MRAVGIFIFDEVEVLDFAGPFEVFSTATRVGQGSDRGFRVFTIGPSAKQVVARGGLGVAPSFTLADHPDLDVLVVPGGIVDAELDRSATTDWIASQAGLVEVTASICTGAFLLGKAGLLEGRRVTTHWEDIDALRKLVPDTTVIENQRWIDEGEIVTSAGISAGIDMSLYLVARLGSRELAIRTARQMEYDWTDA